MATIVTPAKGPERFPSVNDLALVNQVPVEILVKIICQLDTMDRVLCTQVCRYWRSVTLEGPLLWQDLKISLPAPPVNFMPFLEVLFRRSYQQSLAVHFDFPSEITADLAATYARVIEPQMPRVSDLRITCLQAHKAGRLRCIIDLLGHMPSSRLRSLELQISYNTTPREITYMPSLDHLSTLAALSVSGHIGGDIVQLVHQLKALRLPGRGLRLDDAETHSLVQAIVQGTNIEQLEVNASSLYDALDFRLLNGAGGVGVGGTSHAPDRGRLRYIRWPNCALDDYTRFEKLCQFVRSRSELPTSMVLEVQPFPHERVQTPEDGRGVSESEPPCSNWLKRRRTTNRWSFYSHYSAVIRQQFCTCLVHRYGRRTLDFPRLSSRRLQRKRATIFKRFPLGFFACSARDVLAFRFPWCARPAQVDSVPRFKTSAVRITC